MIRTLQVSFLLATAMSLTACGFHLRNSAALPPSMQRIHLNIPTGGQLQRDLERALEGSKVTVEDHAGTGIAELGIPVATFRTDTLTVSGAARVTEYSVRYHAEFYVNGGEGQPLIAHQGIDMSRDFSYDATNTIGTAAQTEQLQTSLITDMVQSIMFRLQAAATHPEAVKAEADKPVSPSTDTSPVMPVPVN
jgi:LPS-assembly lipoprotein